ncbi:unnamed protein product [Effrenium voratum]|nr:unnamed protein product [Effrenium voratum]
MWCAGLAQRDFGAKGSSCCEIGHNAPVAQLVPVVEQFEVTVDVDRKQNQISCDASSARVNVNIDRVLVNFFRTMRQGLEEVQQRTLQAGRFFHFENLTGVRITVQWRQRRGKSGPAELPPGQRTQNYELRSAERFADVRFLEEDFGWEEKITIELDPVLSRAYQIREGCPIFVEPDNDLKEGTVTFRIKSALTIYNDTALPLQITLCTAAFQRWRHQVGDLLRSGTRLVTFNQSMTMTTPTEDWEDDLDAAAHSQSERRKAKDFTAVLNLPPHASAEVPVSWFIFSRQHWPSVRLQVLGAGFEGVSRHFPQLAALLEDVALDDEDLDDEDATGPRLTQRSEERERMGDRTKFSLFLKTYMKLSGYIDAQDMPLALDEEDVQQVQRFKMHLGNLLAIRNMLPFPVVLQLAAPDNSFKDVPLPEPRSVSQLLETRDCSSSSSLSLDPLERVKEEPVRCFSQDLPGEELLQHTQLDGISALALSAAERQRLNARGIATYVLGVDQEVALPFAKRLVRLRCLAMADEQLESESDAEPPEVAVAQGMLKLPAVSANRPHHQSITLESPSGQLVQVSLELTRDSCVLFVPFIFENLTPLTLSMNRDALLGPGCRAVLPQDPQHPDTAFFTFLTAKEIKEAQEGGRSPKQTPLRRFGSNRTSSASSTFSRASLSFAVPFLSDVGREHRPSTRRDHSSAISSRCP